MRRLNFLQDEPWDEVDDDLGSRVRSFGHPFGADAVGAEWESRAWRRAIPSARCPKAERREFSSIVPCAS